MIGKIYPTKNFGSVRIIQNGSKYGYYKVEFLRTKHIDEFRIDTIKNGEIRDKFAVTFCGVGIIGNIKTRGKYKPYYTIWRNMIKRCYDGSNSAYFNKVVVCERWKVFENFYNDVSKIQGWNEEKFNNGELVLDKDLKQRFSKVKIYSTETCMWISHSENACIQDAQQRWFKAISPVGDEFTSYNITKFAREHGLERRSISSVLNKRIKTTFGWKFNYIDEDIV